MDNMLDLPLLQISNSVGRMARNNMRDVRAIQERLNLLMAPSWQPLKPDGMAGPITQAVIGRFQSEVVGFQNADKRVDPRGRTIKALNDPGSATKWRGSGPLPPKPVDPDDPPNPVSPSGPPTISVSRTMDFRRGFDTFPPPHQVLNGSAIVSPPKRDGAWIMIPRGAERVICVDLRPDQPVEFAGKGVHRGNGYDRMRHAVFAADRVGANLIRLRGKYPCQDFALDIVQGDKYARIYVSVKPLRIVPLAVRYVEQKRKFRVLLSGEELRRAITLANNIIFPQSNVKIKILSDSILTYEEIGRRLGRVVDNDEARYLHKFNQNQNFPQPEGARHVKLINMYVVRQIKREKIGTHIGGHADPDSGTIFFDDHSFGRHTSVRSLGYVIAHEVGHILLSRFFSGWKQFAINDYHNPFQDALMYPSGYTGTKLYRAEIEQFNPTPSTGPHYDPTVFT